MGETAEPKHSRPSSSKRSYLSRKFARQVQDAADGSKGPLGLHCVYSPKDAIVDLIFVHGLNGGSYSTWRNGSHQENFWPQKWLPQDEAFSDVRIHTFGYASSWGTESVLNIHDFAMSLLAAIEDSPEMGYDSQAPTRFIFIAHSMGGLVVKEAFIIGHRDPQFKHIVDRVSTILFLATPHRGASLAQTLARLGTILPGQRPFVGSLVPRSERLQFINEEFPRLCGDLKLVSFFETRPMNFITNLIVDKESAVMNVPNERRTPLNANHRNVAKYTSTNDPTYITVRNTLAKLVSPHRNPTRGWKNGLNQEDTRVLSTLLSLTGEPDDIIMQDQQRLPVYASIKNVAAGLDDDRIDTVNPNPVWRRLYLSGILQARINKPQFWVIDAMDECKESIDMMSFLSRIQEYWPVSVLITCRDPVDRHRGNMITLPDIESYTIEDKDNEQDIAISGGCFLWASLICSSLQKVASEKEAKAVMESVPSDMDALYSRIFNDMSASSLGKDCARAVIIWTAYALRPLTTTEMKEPIEIDLQGSIILVADTIKRSCGQIVYVDSQEKVRFVHSTVKEYITAETTSHSVLHWIEFSAEHGNLRTVYQAGKTIISMMARRAQQPPPTSLASRPFSMLEKWGDDLVHLATRFARRLKDNPQAIHHLIPPFCPPSSVIRQQFAKLNRVSVHGISAREWDDCLTTITYDPGAKPNAIAAGSGLFAVGMMTPAGKVIVYDEVIFQEVHVLMHGEPVFRLALSKNGDLLVSAGSRSVRIWALKDGKPLQHIHISSLCLALGFAEDDSILWVATKQNQIYEWDVTKGCLIDVSTWTKDLKDSMQSRTPTMTSFLFPKNVLCVIYRGEKLLLWDFKLGEIYDIYGKESAVSLSEDRAIDARAISLSYTDTNGSRIAVTYTDGDLVLHDMDEGKPTRVARRMNAMALASSPDGRTLAGVDSEGNFTLFELETLQVLYRVRFTTQMLPKCMTFSADSERFIEISGNQCRVWEPIVLLRPDASEINSDTLSVSSGPQEIEFQPNFGVSITAMVCCRSASVVFCAMEDGSVHVYDISVEPRGEKLFTQTTACTIHLLYLDEMDEGSPMILASGDESGRTMVWPVSRRSPHSQTGWTVSAEPLIDAKASALGVLRQVLVSRNHDMLLTCTDQYDTLWPVPKQGEGIWVAQEMGVSSHPSWLQHPLKPELLICVSASQLRVCRWSDLSVVRSIDITLNGTFHQLAPLHHQKYFATVSECKSPSSTSQTKRPCFIQLWDFNGLEGSVNRMEPVCEIDGTGTNADFVIGAFESRMVLSSDDYWISSVKLGISMADLPCTRHFFVPDDWANAYFKLVMGIGSNGEILVAKQSELIVIKGGLKTTEQGKAFFPPRGNNMEKWCLMSEAGEWHKAFLPDIGMFRTSLVEIDTGHDHTTYLASFGFCLHSAQSSLSSLWANFRSSRRSTQAETSCQHTVADWPAMCLCVPAQMALSAQRHIPGHASPVSRVRWPSLFGQTAAVACLLSPSSSPSPASLVFFSSRTTVSGLSRARSLASDLPPLSFSWFIVPFKQTHNETLLRPPQQEPELHCSKTPGPLSTTRYFIPGHEMSGSTRSMAPAVESSHSTHFPRSHSTPNLLLLGSPAKQPLPHHTSGSTATTSAPVPSSPLSSSTYANFPDKGLPSLPAFDVPSFDFGLDFNTELGASLRGDQNKAIPDNPTAVDAARKVWQDFLIKDDIDGATETDRATIACASVLNSDRSSGDIYASTAGARVSATATIPSRTREALPSITKTGKPTRAVEAEARRKRSLIDRPRSWIHSSRSTPNLRNSLENDQGFRQAAVAVPVAAARGTDRYVGAVDAAALSTLDKAVTTGEPMGERSRTMSSSFADFARRPWISRSPSPSPPTKSTPTQKKTPAKKADDGDDSNGFRGKLSLKRLVPTVAVVENISEKGSAKPAGSSESPNKRRGSGSGAGSSSGSDASDATIGPADATAGANGGIVTTASSHRPFSRASEYLTRMRQRPQSMFVRSDVGSPGFTASINNDRDEEDGDVGTDRGPPLINLPLDFLADGSATAPGRSSMQTAESSGSSTHGSSANDSAVLPASEAESLTTADTSRHTSPMAQQPASRDPLWMAFKDLEAAFFKFLSKPSTAQRMGLVRTALTPFLRRYALDSSNKDLNLLSPEDVERRTSILNRWWTALLEMLDSPRQWDGGNNRQTGNQTHSQSSSGAVHFPTTTTTVTSSIYPLSGVDRPAVLDAVSMIMLRPEWRLLTTVFQPLADRPPSDPVRARANTDDMPPTEDGSFLVEESAEHNIRTTFINNLMAQLAFVVERMSMRQVPHSIVNFSGRACAYAFFFVPGVADILVRLWGLDRRIDLVRRSADAFGLPRRSRGESEDLIALFPPCLGPLGWQSVSAIHTRLRRPPKMNLLLSTSATCSRIPWFAPHWLARWRGVDTDLFFIFSKYYYILADDFMPAVLHLPLVEQARAPAYVLLHAQLLHILDNTIHRQAAVEAAIMMAAPPLVDGASAGSASGTADAFAPPFLVQPTHNLLRDMGENRVIALLNDLLSTGESLAGARNTYSQSLMTLLKAAAGRTSQYDHNACYMLCDFLQEIFQVFDGYYGYSNDDGGAITPPPVDLVDWAFWQDVCKMMLNSNNTMSEIRVLSFLYTVWDIITTDDGRREELCLGWLLTEDVFSKFFNNWSPMVRAYYMRLLCWRICRDSGSSNELDIKIYLLVSQRLKTVWSHYLWLKQKAEKEATLPPSTAPALPQPGRRFMIVRTEVNGPQLGLMVNGSRGQGRGSTSAAAIGFDTLASPYSGFDGIIEIRDGTSGSRPNSSASDDKKGDGSSTKKKWSLLGKVLNLASGRSDTTEEQPDKPRRERSFAGTMSLLPPSKSGRLGSASSDSGSSTGSAPVFDSAQFVFKFMLHNIPWQGQSGGPMGSPGAVILPPVYRDRVLTRPRLPAPAQVRVSSRLALAGRLSGSVPPVPAGSPPMTRQISEAVTGGLVNEAKNANPTASIPSDDSSSGGTRPRGDSWVSTSSRASSPAASGGELDAYSRSNSLEEEFDRDRERERAVVQPAEPIGCTTLLRAKYSGKALAEWSLVVNECNSFVDRRRDEGVSALKDVEVPCLGIEGLRRLN
ncbi:GPI inositol-deacylase [Grosmannia clavigera kw1407]|uniref:GPI inositol-deacylase n=1 Tax=Grosmannia clavigera (strain kw1407 / UAMH 11150) TaxID=655863 RepID=F0XSE9_GROCL|nr:GPI inositol-deacylase [Grosmannia clavigera kw1407]EFW99551.1 GPI inositol-deacylase [Grosmannia clavigera kw1407]